VIIAAQAATNLDVTDVTDELIFTGGHQVQYCIPLGTAVYYLAQEVILSAF